MNIDPGPQSMFSAVLTKKFTSPISKYCNDVLCKRVGYYRNAH